MSKPWSRQLHRKYNNLVMNLEKNTIFNYAEGFPELIKSYEFQERELVEYKGEKREVGDRLISRFGNK